MRSNKKNIPLASPTLSRQAFKNVKLCFDENWLSQGSFNKELEELFAKKNGTKYATTCSNGTAALWLALKSVGVGPGDEVIVPTLTFSATAAAVVAAGGSPVFADSLPEDGNIDPASVEKLVTKKTKAIIPVDLYGIAASYDQLRRIARKHKLFIIEDAAEGLGGSYKSKPLGSLGDIGTFSFFANKVITTGEGGMCVTNSRKLLDSMILFKNHGNPRARMYFPEVSGFNMRMTNVQAAIGLSQLKDMPQFLTKRYRIFEYYMRALKKYPYIKPLSFVKRTYAPWMFTVRVTSHSTNTIIEGLQNAGIESRPGFHCLHLTPAFKKYVKAGQLFPVAEKLSKELINLPSHVKISAKDIQYIVSILGAITS